MGGPLVISQMTSFAGALGGTELFPIVATSAGALTNYNISASGIAAFVVVNFPAQSPNTVYSGPASGVATAAPTFRVLVTADLPLVPVPGGGTNTTTLTNNGVLYGQGTSTIGITPNAATGALLMSNGTNAGPSFIAAGTSGYPLVANGTVSLPTYQLLNLTTGATGVLTVPFGGSGTSTLTQNGVLFGNAANTVGITAAGGTSLPLLGQGVGNAPSFGVVPVVGGGTGDIFITAHAVLVGNGTGAINVQPIGTAGQLLIDQGTGVDPQWKVVAGDVTITSLGTTTIGANAVTLAKFTQGTGLSVLGNNTAATANFTAIGSGGANQILAINNAATTVLWQGLSTTIDLAIGSTQGVLLTRNATAWIALAPGGVGSTLISQGAGANLAYTSAAAGAGTVTSISAAYGMSSLGVGTSGQTAITGSGTLTRVEFVSAKTAAYTIATTDLGSLVTFSSASLATFTLPTPNATALGTGFFVDIQNINSGLLVLLGSACNINALGSASLSKNQGGRIVSDGANYQFRGDAFGVVINVATGTGLTGGPITTSGTVSVNVATAAQILADTASVLIDPVGLWSSALVSTLTFTTGQIAVDFNTGSNFAVTLTGNCTLGNPSNTKIGQNGIVFITQDGTGGRTMAYTTSWKFIGGTAPVLSIASSAVDLLSFFVKDSTHVYASLMPNMK